jgi:hypothetical protein
MKFLLAIILFITSLTSQGTIKGSHSNVDNTYGCGDCLMMLHDPHWIFFEPTIGYPLTFVIDYGNGDSHLSTGILMFSVAGGPMWEQLWGWSYNRPHRDIPCNMWLLDLGIQVPFSSNNPGVGFGTAFVKLPKLPSALFKSTWYTQAAIVTVPTHPSQPYFLFMSQAMRLTIGDKL